MPTYEYVCTSCGHQWETEQRITADPLKTCPKCSADTAKRQVSGGSFILKGGGWYADLYSSSPKPKADSGGGSSGGTKSAPPAKSDSAGGSSSGSGSGTGTGTGSGSGSGSGSSGGSTPSST